MPRSSRSDSVAPAHDVSLFQEFDGAPMAIVAIAQSGTITRWNRQASVLFARDDHETIGIPFSTLLPPDQQPRFHSMLAISRDGMATRNEFTILTPRGERRDIALALGATPPGAEDNGCVVAIIDDIRERKRIEQLLRNSEETYRNLVESAPVAIFVHTEGHFVFLNPAARDLFGADQRHALLGEAIESYLDENDRPAFRSAIAQAAETPLALTRLTLHVIPLAGAPRTVDTTFIGVDYNGCLTRMAICIDVTERHQAEEDLRNQANFIRTLLETIPAPIFYKDTRGVYTGCNRAFETYIGKPRAEIIGRSVFDLAPPDLARVYFQADNELLTSGGSQVYETQVLFADGLRHDILFSKATFNDDQGNRAGLIGTMVDISERKAREEMALLVARGVAADIGDNFFRSLTHYLAEAMQADLVFIGERHGEFIKVLAGRQGNVPMTELVYPLAGTPCEKILNSGRPFTCRDNVRQHFPQACLFTDLKVEGFTGSPLFDSTGVARGILVALFLQPIPSPPLVENLLQIFAARAAAELQRLQAEHALLESEAQHRRLTHEYETIFNGTPDALTVWSPDQRLIWANRAADSSHGKRVSDLTGAPCTALCTYTACAGDDCELRHCLQTGQLDERMRKTRDGRSWGVKTFPLLNEAGQIVRIIRLASDLTERIRLREEANRASHLAALGEIAAGVAHEVNNPTALILLDLPILRDILRDVRPILETHYQRNGDFPCAGLHYSLLRDQIPAMCDEVFEGAQRIKHIVDELKDFSRPTDPHQFDLVDLNEVVAKAKGLISGKMKKLTDHFTATYAPDLPPVHGSIHRLEQVVINLLLNAAQSLSDRGRAVTVTVKSRPQVRRNAIVIEDEGIGISAEHLPQITDPFFTTRREVGGTGLGLSVSSRIIQEHGGTLHFESTPGRGTIVTIELPQAEGIP